MAKNEAASLRQIQKLQGRFDTLTLGRLPAPLWRRMMEAWPNAVGRDVILIAERRRHYLQRHPDIAYYEALLTRALFQPDEVHRNRTDSDIAIFYYRLEEDFALRVALWISTESSKQNSVHSFRLARSKEMLDSMEAGRSVWQKR